MKRIVLILALTALALSAGAGNIRIRGRVTESDGKPVAGAVVRLDGNYLWAVTGSDGRYTVKDAEKGDYTLIVSCLGFVEQRRPIALDKDLDGMDFTLKTESLALEGVVVTAENDRDALSTTRTIGRAALDHSQIAGVGDIAALLPGGKTVNPDLTASHELILRGGGSTAGNAAFATAVEVNGVRMGGNASFGGLAGVDTRSVPVAAIESVEVISGVPSAEYGDLGPGMIRINTQKGRTPVNITLSANPRTWDAAVSKGFSLPRGGTFNLSAQWSRATSKLTSPYTSYTRRSLTAEYTRTFGDIFHLEAGITGNLGGMNSRGDPDSFADERSRGRDNVLAPRIKASLLLGKSWITGLSLEASLYYHDRRLSEHLYNSYSSPQPAVHASEKGYFFAESLPTLFYADRVTDSRELDYSASLRYDWVRHFGPVKNVLKAGLQWKADGNVGRGEYYEDPSLAANGYRPRPYSDYPYLHNAALWIEDRITVPVGKTRLEGSFGLRAEKAFVKGTQYRRLGSLSPRINLRWNFPKGFSVRGGWGISRKLPSFWVLFPRDEYRDILSTGFSHGDEATYSYLTLPYTLAHNPDLRWQSSRNAELGFDFEHGQWKISLAAFHNVTRNPYTYADRYEPVSYNLYRLPDDGSRMPENPELKIDHQSGQIYIRGGQDEYFTPLELLASDRTFINVRTQEGGADVLRTGVELTADFPEIRPIRTRLRLDAAYTHTYTLDTRETYYYPSGYSDLTGQGRSFPYVGVYSGGNSVSQGRRTDRLDANLTVITHIPAIRLIVTCRVEAALVRSTRNLSDRAFTVEQGLVTPTGGDIYAGDSFTAVNPVAYIDTDGVRHEWTDGSADDPNLRRLVVTSGNRYTFAADGYSPWVSANLSLTKEFGKHVSLSFFVNNFTASRPYRTSRATGVAAIFTPAFYYGLTCRIKI